MRRPRREFVARAARIIFAVYVRKKPAKAAASMEHVTPRWSRAILSRFEKSV